MPLGRENLASRRNESELGPGAPLVGKDKSEDCSLSLRTGTKGEAEKIGRERPRDSVLALSIGGEVKADLQRVSRIGLALTLVLVVWALGLWVGSAKREIPAVSVETEAVSEALELMGELSEIEAALYQGASWVEHHAILAERHQRVSAIACSNAESHTESMEKLSKVQRQRISQQKAAMAASEKAKRDGLSGKRLASAQESSKKRAREGEED